MRPIYGTIVIMAKEYNKVMRYRIWDEVFTKLDEDNE